ncbi:hypothetical protein SAMN05444128_3955 [Pontibacter indicus]|uniref:Uncharacterized protein n=1 Tax=Pontibacter indicus TaxID=1317125 RepID=A0A1R3XVN8_9BACT|nr:hypothetical protein SAMN05444128_3955 [Pontibacter indicus]
MKVPDSGRIQFQEFAKASNKIKSGSLGESPATIQHYI